MKHIITYNGKTYVFVKDEIDEVHQHFLNRVWWIVKNIDKHPNIDKNTLYNMSFVWSNVVHMGVTYDDKTMEQLEIYMVQDNKKEDPIA
jgi:hypothetical protein